MKAAFDELREHDLVVLIQSTVFRIPEFRTRVELFRRGIKVIEHSNLDRMELGEFDTYVAALAYDPVYYRGVGHSLKERMDAARTARIESGGETLCFDSPLETAKLNIGDFAGLKNVGSHFPIGEVFTEARDLESVHGRVKIYAFTDTSFRLNVPEAPITLQVERGRVVGALDSTERIRSGARGHPGPRRRGLGSRAGVRDEPRIFTRAPGHRCGRVRTGVRCPLVARRATRRLQEAALEPPRSSISRRYVRGNRSGLARRRGRVHRRRVVLRDQNTMSVPTRPMIPESGVARLMPVPATSKSRSESMLSARLGPK